MKIVVHMIKTTIDRAIIDVGDIAIDDADAISKLAIDVIATLAPSIRIGSHTQFIPCGIVPDDPELKTADERS